MKFEVVNDKGATVMCCTCAACIPCDDWLSAMAKSGYKFKIDGKNASKKKVLEIRSSKSNP